MTLTEFFLVVDHAVEKLFPEMPADDQTALWKSKEEVYRLISTKMTPLPGLVDFLDRCRDQGLAMILVTNAPRLDALHTLEVLHLSDRYVTHLAVVRCCVEGSRGTFSRDADALCSKPPTRSGATPIRVSNHHIVGIADHPASSCPAAKPFQKTPPVQSQTPT